jgi:hypothetical protein
MGKVVACRDTDGDGKADKFVDFVQSVDSPRGSDHTTNGCRMGIDGWLYIAGTVANVKASEIRSRKQLGITMMPAGLTAGLTTAEFTSLIE